MKKAVSHGGGVNGVAMLIAMVRSGDVPDVIFFADTGEEEEAAYRHIEYFSKWLESKGFPKITIVTYKTKRGKRITLGQEIIKAKTLPSIAFGFKTCSQKHKIHPQHKWVRSQWGKESVTWYIGFDANEQRRVKPNPVSNYTNKYPLIELGWDRARCIEEIEKEGVIVPGKTACKFCPNRKREEILSLSKEDQQYCINIERNAKATLKKVVGLGRRFKWEDLINGNTTQADQEQLKQEHFKKVTGEELEPVVCECID